MTALLSARDLFRFYHTGDEEVVALRGVSLEVMPGEMLAVVGPSGSGKSTLLNCLAGLDDPNGGTVTVVGTRISRQPEAAKAAIRANHIGMFFQAANLVEHLTVAENIALARSLNGDHGDGHGVAAGLLDGLGLSSRGDALPEQLSGGETARAGLAVALANDPDVLLADEPSAEVDERAEERILDLLLDRAGLGKAVVVVTHSRAVADHADRVLGLHDGRPVHG
jgi:putative ABC transport system ATP-binding protein